MAIWQFQTFMLPRSAVLRHFGSVPADVPEESLSDIAWWSDMQPPADYETRIGQIAPRYDSWSDSISMWGSEQGDRIHVLLDEPERRTVEEIVIRIDLRQFSRDFTAGIVRLAAEFDCVLWVEPHRVVEPTMRLLCEAILQSQSAAFMRDPEGFLKSLPKETV